MGLTKNNPFSVLDDFGSESDLAPRRFLTTGATVVSVLCAVDPPPLPRFADPPAPAALITDWPVMARGASHTEAGMIRGTIVHGTASAKSFSK